MKTLLLTSGITVIGEIMEDNDAYASRDVLKKALARLKEEYENDFYEEAEELYVREEPKIGRNDPCPCGSGKKYKKCCGKG